jgi:hypothetical protein
MSNAEASTPSRRKRRMGADDGRRKRRKGWPTNGPLKGKMVILHVHFTPFGGKLDGMARGS